MTSLTNCTTRFATGQKPSCCHRLSRSNSYFNSLLSISILRTTTQLFWMIWKKILGKRILSSSMTYLKWPKKIRRSPKKAFISSKGVISIKNLPSLSCLWNHHLLIPKVRMSTIQCSRMTLSSLVQAMIKIKRRVTFLELCTLWKKGYSSSKL